MKTYGQKHIQKDDPKRLTLTITENQLSLIQYALEQHFRLCMGQYYIDIVEELCFQNLPMGDDGFLLKDEFNAALDRRDKAQEKLKEFFDVCFERNWKRTQKTPAVQAEIDMWSAIRHWRWEQEPENKRGNGVDSYPPFQFGPDPLPDLMWEDGK